jgi:hypothetical protein
MTRRPETARRPAAENSRSRSRLGSHRRAWRPARARVCSHAVSSQASNDGAPDPVLGEVVQRQVRQPAVLGAADAVFGAGAAAVPQTSPRVAWPTSAGSASTTPGAPSKCLSRSRMRRWRSRRSWLTRTTTADGKTCLQAPRAGFFRAGRFLLCRTQAVTASCRWGYRAWRAADNDPASWEGRTYQRNFCCLVRA